MYGTETMPALRNAARFIFLLSSELLGHVTKRHCAVLELTRFIDHVLQLLASLNSKVAGFAHGRMCLANATAPASSTATILGGNTRPIRGFSLSKEGLPLLILRFSLMPVVTAPSPRGCTTSVRRKR